MSYFSLYIHIPYCKKKCPYCDFNVYALRKVPEDEYVEALLGELSFRAKQDEWKNRKVATIFFGGGTPSLFSAKSFDKVLKKVEDLFGITKDAEISLEANPTELSKEKLADFKEVGINRLSIGVQSFDNKILKLLGRDHDSKQIFKVFQSAKNIGFDSLSLDIIYGNPNQTLEQVDFDLDCIEKLMPNHFSAYSLTIEKGTSFYNSEQRGLLSLPEDELVLRMMDLIQERAEKIGFKRYEISNYCREGKFSRHNWNYWSGVDYLGIGAGSHSYYRNNNINELKNYYAIRFANLADHKSYLERVLGKSESDNFVDPTSWQEQVNFESACFEYFFTGLRKIEGVSIKLFEETYKVDFMEKYNDLVCKLEDHGYVEKIDDMLRLTKEGIYIADSVIESWLNDLSGKS